MPCLRFDDYIARPALVSRLREAFTTGQAFHAYLFVGPEGIGKRNMARTCAQALFCTDEPAFRPCGKCPGCLQFAQGHPDVHTLAPAKGRKLIAAEDVRSVARELANKAFSGRWKIVFVDEAELLNKEGQNALLKPLEEALSGTVFFLCAQSQSVLLPTVVSRCRIVRFAPIDNAVMAGEIKKRNPELSDEEARWAAAFSEGSVARAFAYVAQPESRKTAQSVQKAWNSLLAGGNPAEVIGLLPTEKEQAAEVLRCLESIARQALHGDNALGAELMDALMQARQMLSVNVIWQNVLETVVMRMTAAIAAKAE